MPTPIPVSEDGSDEPASTALVRRSTEGRPVTEAAYRQLLDRCDALAFDDPATAIRAGVAASRLVGRVVASPERRLALKARSFAHIGSAYLAGGDTRAAESAFVCAATLGRGARLLDTADLYRRWAYLDVERRHFEDALDHVDRARSLASGLGEARVESYLLAASGRTHVAAGRHATGARELAVAVERIPRETAVDYGELLGAVFDLTTAFAAGGRAEAELAFLEVHLEVLLRLGVRHFDREAIAVWRLHWLSAKVDAAAGRPAAAESALLACRDTFRARGRPFEMAVVSLDLAELYLVQGRPDDLGRVAANVFPILGKARWRQETLEALRLFYRCALAGSLTADLLARVRAATRPAAVAE